jgi:hypothetical protein
MATMTTEELLNESARVDLELKLVTLELNKESLQKLQDAKTSRLAKMRKQAMDMAENERQKTMREANCKHRKGGRNKEGLDKGNDSDYAVIQNTYPTGQVQIMCQRCGATWDNPPIELKALDPDLYNLKLRAYRRALEWPTDNEPSGTQIFLITKTADLVAIEQVVTKARTPAKAAAKKAAKKTAAHEQAA